MVARDQPAVRSGLAGHKVQERFVLGRDTLIAVSSELSGYSARSGAARP